MKSKSAKAKGRRLCAEVKELLHKYAPDLKPGDIEITSSSVGGVDLKLSPAAFETYPLAIECKNQEKLNIWEALEQARRHGISQVLAHGGAAVFPVVFFSRNHTKPYVALEAEDFIRILG